MIGAGFGMQAHRPIGSFHQPVAQIGILLAEADIIAVKPVDFLKNVSVDCEISTPYLGLASIQRRVKPALPEAFKNLGG